MTGRRRVVAQQWISVDGFASGPTDEWELFTAVPEAADAAAMAHNAAFLPEVETVVLGRRTYESFVDFWPTDRASEVPVAPLVNAVPKLVASTTLTAAPWGSYAHARAVVGAAPDRRRGPRRGRDAPALRRRGRGDRGLSQPSRAATVARAPSACRASRWRR